MTEAKSAVDVSPQKNETNPRNQFIAGGIVLCTVSMSVGTMFGFSAILLPQLEEENVMMAKSEEASWVASIVNITQIFGSIISGSLAGAFGRKKVILLSSIFMIVGWAIIGLSDGNYGLLITGRLVHGAFFLASVSQIYLAEISDSKRRSILAGSGPLFVSTGITVVYTSGAFLPWRWVCLVCAIFPAASILLWTCLPETPTWLVHNGHREEAEKTLQWLRGPNYDVAEEVKALEFEGSPAKKDELAKNNEKSKNGFGNLMLEMSKPSALKPFILLMLVFTMQQSCGSFAVIFYAVTVFKDCGVATNPYFAAILTGLIRQAGALLGAILLSRFPLKLLMVFSALSMAISMLALGGTIQLKLSYELEDQILHGNSTEETDYDRSTIKTVLSILPIVEIVAYMLTFGFGVGTVPWLLLGELCPIQVKGFASGVVACMASAMIFIVVKVFPLLVLKIGADGTYYLFASMCLCTAVFSYFFIPDTRGKSTAQLQMLYQKQPKIITVCD